MTANITVAKGFDVLSFCFFTVRATNSSISSLVIMSGGRVSLVLVHSVATLTESRHGCDAGGVSCWYWVLEVASSTQKVFVG